METPAEIPMPWRRTKIICTLGPSTDVPGVLEALCCPLGWMWRASMPRSARTPAIRAAFYR
jgi:hypothetical protein